MTNKKVYASFAEFAGMIFGLLVVALIGLSFSAWLLTLVLSWFGVVSFGFWKAVVVVLLIQLLLGAVKISTHSK